MTLCAVHRYRICGAARTLVVHSVNIFRCKPPRKDSMVQAHVPQEKTGKKKHTPRQLSEARRFVSLLSAHRNNTLYSCMPAFAGIKLFSLFVLTDRSHQTPSTLVYSLVKVQNDVSSFFDCLFELIKVIEHLPHWCTA